MVNGESKLHVYPFRKIYVNMHLSQLRDVNKL
jgi:hypothetical protein